MIESSVFSTMGLQQLFTTQHDLSCDMYSITFANNGGLSHQKDNLDHMTTVCELLLLEGCPICLKLGKQAAKSRSCIGSGIVLDHMEVAA